MSNKSNSTDVLPMEFLILSVVIQFLFSLFCLFMVIYLSIRLKKRAWDTPAKKFAHIFNVCFALAKLNTAVYLCTNFIGVHSDIILLGLLLFSLTCYLYFIAMYSLQIVFFFLRD